MAAQNSLNVKKAQRFTFFLSISVKTKNTAFNKFTYCKWKYQYNRMLTWNAEKEIYLLVIFVSSTTEGTYWVHLVFDIFITCYHFIHI